MSSKIQIAETAYDCVDLASFAFALPNADPGNPGQEDLARLRVDLKEGASILVKGTEAVTLKVLLASLGIHDISSAWESPWTIGFPKSGSEPVF